MQKVGRSILLILVFLQFLISVSAQPIMLKNDSEEENDASMYVRGDKDFSLIMAAWKGDIESVKKLLNNGANINATTDDGVTPLIYAAEIGNYEICYTLLKAGADPNMRDNSGQSALLSTSKNGQRFIADILLRSGANVNLKDDLGRTALHYTSVWADTGFVNLLLRSGANIYAKDMDSTDAFMAAVINNNTENILFLLSKGAKINTSDNSGTTPLMVSIGNENIDMAKLLLSKGADINTINKHQQSALTIAIQLHNENLVNFLIENGADVNAKLNKAVTPLTIAKYYRANESILFLLKDKGAVENVLPDFGRYFIGPEISFNSKDFLIGIGGGVRELKFGFDVNAGVLARPYPVRAEKKVTGNWFQFWEYRYSGYLGVNKIFSAYLPRHNIQLGVVTGVKEVISIPDYKSAEVSTNTEYALVPELGFLVVWRGIQFSTQYNYWDSNTEIISKHRLGFGVKFIIGAKKHFNISNYSKWNKKVY